MSGPYVARQLLLPATRTSVGQVVSARVLERQVSRLLADPYSEARAIGLELRRAAEVVVETPTVEYPEPVRAAPTLVKYTAPAEYPAAALDRVRALLVASVVGMGGRVVDTSCHDGGDITQHDRHGGGPPRTAPVYEQKRGAPGLEHPALGHFSVTWL